MKKINVICPWKSCKYNKDRNCTKELITLRDASLGPKVCLSCEDYEDKRPPEKIDNRRFGICG